MALIPPFFIDCVVAIGADDADGKRRRMASGFFYGRYTGEKTDAGKAYNTYLVTNRHVFEGLSKGSPKVYVRLNPQADEPARDHEFLLADQQGARLWIAHPEPEVDIAVIPVSLTQLWQLALQVAGFRNDEHVATIDKMNELGVTEGDFAYVLGFPMGIVGEKRNTVIVRGGPIARIRDVLARANRAFLVDASVFPGNSGGPVFLKPEGIAIEGTSPQSNAYLIGVVQSYVPYQEIAISLQTRRPRVIFEENTGLAAVHPVDFIEETILEHRKSVAGPPAPAAPHK